MGFLDKIKNMVSTEDNYANDGYPLEQDDDLSAMQQGATRTPTNTGMSINAVANYFHLRWHTVKELEKRYLKHRFARIPTAHIKAIGIDEIHVGNGKADSQYLTIVRDLDSGAVIHVGDGKGINALAGRWTPDFSSS